MCIRDRVISDSGDSEAASYMPPIRFREVRANGESYDVGALMRRGRMVLRHHQNAFSLSIAALDYVNGSNYSYFYNIEGLDGDWHDNYHSNTLAFAAFPTGRYALGVRYRNNTTGEWSPVSRLPIRVLAPPYASTWAWIGYLAATLGVVIGVSGYLIRRRRLRARLRQSLYEQRQRELVYESCIWSFSNLTNELSIPVTLINGPCQQIMGCKSADAFVRRQAELIRHNAQKINDLIYMLNEFQSTDPVDGWVEMVMLDVGRRAGGVAQVRAVAASLIRVAKESDLPTLLVGHVTKDGGIAGPRVLEHLVDVVCQFEGDRHSRLRLLRAVKNRYGPTDEVGCFELTDSGIYGLADPSGLFLSRTTRGVPGTCAAVSLEGRRPLPTEIQSLVAPSSGGSPRRTTSGVDHARVAMILAVLQARIGADTSGADVYVSTVGGARTVEPAIDLAMAISIVSSLKGVPPRADLVAVGEISLTGEVRACTGTQRRLAEAARLGFSSAIVPAQGSEDLAGVDGITVFTVSDLAAAIRVAFPADSQ